MSGGLSTTETEVVDRLAGAVVRRGLTAPAILFLESVRPLNFVASQALLFFAPMVGLVLERRDYDTLQGLLERRESIELILLRIEALDRRGRGPGAEEDAGEGSDTDR